MPKENMYRNVSIVLGIVAIVFAVLFFTKDEKTSDSLETASDKLSECRDNIATWQSKNKTGPLSVEAQGELSGILNDCKGAAE
ncbi:MAG: hypothetical protein Q7K26_04440 [bacterium]|nr:hypothetical protein [bacterium]